MKLFFKTLHKVLFDSWYFNQATALAGFITNPLLALIATPVYTWTFALADTKEEEIPNINKIMLEYLRR